jgi:hypothetical protein
MLFNKTKATKNKKASPSFRKINLRTLCALNVMNTSAKEISRNLRMSRREASSSLGYALLVRTGCEIGIRKLHQKRNLKKKKSSK